MSVTLSSLLMSIVVEKQRTSSLSGFLSEVRNNLILKTQKFWA